MKRIRVIKVKFKDREMFMHHPDDCSKCRKILESYGVEGL